MRKQLSPQDVLDFYKSQGLPESFCPVPFSTMLFEANGKVCMCRRKGTDFTIGDMRTQTYEEIWNGETLRSIRREFLTGNVKTCAVEVERDLCHLGADTAELLPFIEFNEVQSRSPVRITPNFNGYCNLECVMCHIWQFPNGFYDQIDFWPKLEAEIIPHLKEIDTFSGEPFLQKDTFRLIDLVTKINPEVIWSFTTNGNWLLNDHIRSYLDKIPVKTFSLSIDSFDSENYKTIRRKGSLEKVLENFSRLKKYEEERLSKGLSSLGLSVHVVIQKGNWQEVPQIVEFRKKNGIRLNLNCLLEPVELSLTQLSWEERKKIVYFYLESLDVEGLRSATTLIRTLLEDWPPIEKAQFLLCYKSKIARDLGK